jgi:hypothetical protein
MNTKIDSFIRTSIATALVLSAGAALAVPGHLTGITAQKSVVKVGQIAPLLVTGTVKSCGVEVNNGAGKTWHIALTDPSPSPSKSFGTVYDKPGKYKVVAKGAGNTDADCSSISAVSVDITVLGDAPACTSDAAVQKDYQAIGVQVKTCEMSSTRPVAVRVQPTPGASTADVGSTQPNVAIAPAKITEIALSSTYVQVGQPFTIQVKGSGMKPQDCPSSIVIDQLSPKVVMDYGHQPAKWNSNGFPRNETSIIKEEGTYQVRLMLHDWSYSCVNSSLIGNLAKFTVGPAIAK